MRRAEIAVKKTYNLPPNLVSRVRRLLKAKTETEAIVRSLEAMADDQEIVRTVRWIGGKLPGFKPLR